MILLPGAAVALSRSPLSRTDDLSRLILGRSYLHTNVKGDAVSPYALTVQSISNLQPQDNFLATQVWPSARAVAAVLQSHVRQHHAATTTPMIICEFGCGPGLPSITAAAAGAASVIATDVDPLALQLVSKAAQEQNLSSLTTHPFDLIHSYVDEIPHADLYVFSDVFENGHVAAGTARVVAEILERGRGASVWVFAQTDRAQRETFLEELRRLLGDPTLSWKEQQADESRGKECLVVPHPEELQYDGTLWLCDVDEQKVTYA